MKKKILFNSLVVLSLTTLVLVYVVFVFIPSKELVINEIEHGFKEDMRIESLIFDNAIASFKKDATSISSRSMIRNKIEDYQNGEISLLQLQEYTRLKYAEGVNTFNNIIYALRISNNKRIADLGTSDSTNIDELLKEELPEKLSAGLFFYDTLPLVYVISPIQKGEKHYGFDIIYFEPSFVPQHERNYINFDIYRKAEGNYVNKNGGILSHEIDNILFRENNRVKFCVLSRELPACFLFSLSKPDLYHKLNQYFREQVIIFTLLIILFLLTIFVINRRSSFIIINKKRFLEEQVKKSTASLKDKVAQVEQLNNTLDHKNINLFKVLEQVQEKEKQLLKAEAIANIGHWEMDLTTQKVIASVGARKIYGLGTVHEELTIAKVQKFVLPEYRHVMNKALNDLITLNKPYDVHFKIRNALTGEIRHIYSMAEYYKERKVVFGIIRDVTSHTELLNKTKEQNSLLLDKNEKLHAFESELLATNDELRDSIEKLRSSEEKYRALYNNAPLAYQSLDARGHFIDVNPAWLKTLGYQRDEIIGKWFGSMLTDEMKPFFKKRFEHFKKKGVISGSQFSMVKKSGEVIIVSFEGCIGYDNKGNFKQTYCTFKEITRQFYAEQALKESEERFKALHSASYGGIAIHDHGTIIECNQGLSEMTGYQYEELIGTDIYKFIAKESQQLVMEKIELVTEAPYEALLVLKNGTRIHARFEARNIPYKGKMVRTLEIRDITREKESLNLIKKERNLAQKYLSVAGVIMVSLNKKGVVTLINQKGQDILGYKADELVGKNWFDTVIIENKSEEIKSLFNQLIAGRIESAEYVENSVVTKNGEERIISWYNALLYNEKGEVEGTLSSGEDITESRKAEIKLKESEERLKLSIEGSNIGIWDWNIKTGETTVNEQWASMLGHSLQELKPTTIDTWERFCHPDDLELSNQKLKEHLAGITEEYECEVRAKHKNGQWIWILDKGKIVARDSKKKPLRMSGTHLDITERKKAEQIKIESEQRFKAMFYDNTSVMLLIEPDSGKIVDVNNTAVKFYGYPMEKLKSMKIQQINALPDSEVKAEMNKAKLKHQDYFTFRHLMGSGQVKDVQIYSSPLSVDNKQLLFSIVQDITAQKIAEEAVIENEHQLQLIYDNSPAMMMLLDERLQILKINHAGVKFSDKKPDMAIGKPVGDIFSCIQAAKKPGHCKVDNDCNQCTLRNTIVKTFKTGKSYQGIESELDVMRNGKPFTLTVLIATTVAAFEPQKTVLVTIDDVTDQKRAQRALMDSERRFRAIIEGASDAVIIADSQTGEIINANNKAEELTGHPRNELLGSQQTYLHPSEKSSYYKNEFKDTVDKKGQKTILKEMEVLHSSGRIIPVEISSSIITLNQKELVVEFFRDISQRKVAEKQLEQSYTKYKMLAEYTYDWEYWKGPDGVYIYISPACKRISGFTISDFEKTPNLFEKRVIEEDKPTWLMHEKETEKRRITKKPVEVRFKTRKGKVIWISHVSRPVYDDKNNFLGYRGVNRDITQQKNAQLQVEESKERFKHLADFTYEGILIHKNGIILDANTSMLKMSGYTFKEIKGKNLLHQFIPEKYHNQLLEKMQQKKVNPYQLEVKNKKGDILQVEIAARAISSESTEVRVVAVRDITEQKQMQQKILQAIIETEEAERIRVAQELHDGLGPVLSTVKLYTETYLKSSDGDFKKKIEDQLLSSVDEAIGQISNISNNLSPHILQDFGLKTALERFIERLEKVTSLEIILVYPEKLRFKQEIKITLYRVLTELLNNTVKHAHASRVNIAVQRKGNNYKLFYTDNGKGFDLKHIKLQKKGMGLFNIIQRVNALGGEVDFEQVVDNGIKYTITIPYNTANFES